MSEAIGWVYGRPVGRESLAPWADPHSEPDGPSERRRRRWAAQVALTHELLHTWYRPAEPPPTARPDSILLGTILAAVSASCPCSAQRLEQLDSDPCDPEDDDRPEEFVIVIEDGRPFEARTVRRTALTGSLGAALHGADVGTVIALANRPAIRLLARRPARDTAPSSAAAARPASLSATRRLCEWTDAEFARGVVVAAGYEHPGDPRSPDFLHHH